jgi:hypothetical protein
MVLLHLLCARRLKLPNKANFLVILLCIATKSYIRLAYPFEERILPGAKESDPLVIETLNKLHQSIALVISFV